jgi:hypothetical protein
MSPTPHCGRGAQLAAPAVEYASGAQGVHSAAPPCENEFGRQAAQEELRAAENDPGAQGSHPGSLNSVPMTDTSATAAASSPALKTKSFEYVQRRTWTPGERGVVNWRN